MKTILKNIPQRIGLALALAASSTVSAFGDALESGFRTPPAAARPGVYWYFLEGNQDRNQMVTELRAMKEAGLGSVLFLEVSLAPPGPVAFMSQTWQENVANAFAEAGKLGMEVMLGTGPGWCGSGGSWVAVEDSMQHLAGASLRVQGPGRFDQALPVPPPLAPNPFSGVTPPIAKRREAWFKDVAVLAFPAPSGGAVGTIDDVKIKTLKDVAPYSIRATLQRYVAPLAAYAEADVARTLDPGRMVDLTSRLKPDGRLDWEIPPGEWVIMRFVSRSTGQTTRPAPQAGFGFECNKFDGESYRRHWEHYQQKLLDAVGRQGGSLQPGRGLTTIHLDSWEMSSQNWTAGFREAFKKRRGYDPQPFYPAWLGQVVGSVEKTERFLWDMRKTAQELLLDEYAGAIKRLAHKKGLLFSCEPYDMNPAGNLDLGSIADIPMGEFWSDANDTQYSCVEAVSIARTMGRSVVKAESFTSQGECFSKTPALLKNQTDWALAMGINGFMFHTFEHQPLGEKGRPGMTLGPHGLHWNINQPFWPLLTAYHEYITRCSQLLRQGQAVSDILYLTPEGAPHIFEAPADAFEGDPWMRDKKGYGFDAVSPRILAMRARVEDGRIAFPNGSAYRVLVLPSVPTMTPEALACVARLVKAGATVVGNPPVKSPSLVNYPDCDAAVSKLATKLWGGTQPPATVTRVPYGKGAIYWGGDLEPKQKELYPSYASIAALLAGLGLPQDFSSPSGKLRYLHRQTADRDIYFIANRTGERVETDMAFRVGSLQPQLWDPLTGTIRDLDVAAKKDGLTRVPLAFEPFQSFVMVFPRRDVKKPTVASRGNDLSFNQVAQLEGAWEVSFDPALGGPEKVLFNSLMDWSANPEEGIRYYSGIATYHKTFDLAQVLNGSLPVTNGQLYLDLGKVGDLCRVRLNGKDLGVIWTAPWRVEISGAVRATGNELQIEVANSWVNRLIGDQQPANKDIRTVSWPSGLLGGGQRKAGRYTFVTHNYYNAASPLRPSGLIGPVALVTCSQDRKTLNPTENQ